MKSRKTDLSTFIAIRDSVPTLPAVFSQETATTAITWQADGGSMNRPLTSAPSPNTLVKTANKYGYKKSRWEILRFLIGFVISKCANISAHLDVNNCTAVNKEKGFKLLRLSTEYLHYSATYLCRKRCGYCRGILQQQFQSHLRCCQ